MTVWTLSRIQTTEGVDSITLLGIYSNEKKAKESLQEYEKNTKSTSICYETEDWIVE